MRVRGSEAHRFKKFRDRWARTSTSRTSLLQGLKKKDDGNVPVDVVVTTDHEGCETIDIVSHVPRDGSTAAVFAHVHIRHPHPQFNIVIDHSRPRC